MKPLNINRKSIAVVLCLLALQPLLLSGCSGDGPTNSGVYLLLDTSGTYTRELGNAQKLVNVMLVKLEPSDSFAVARIDTGSFSEKDIVAKVTFDQRPSVANTQKRAFQKKVADFVKGVHSSSHTDISGGLLQAVEYLNEAGSGQKYVLIFSDLKEELAKGHVRDVPFQLDGFNIIALNVTKLRDDIRDPKNYMQRVELWRVKTEIGGGEWRVINDLERLDHIFSL